MISYRTRQILGVLLLFPGMLCLTRAMAHPDEMRRGAEIRAVWMSPGMFGAEKEAAVTRIQSTLDAFSQAGINTIMMTVKSTSGKVYFNSNIGPTDTAWHWDFFGTFLGEARKRNITVHPWFCVFTEGEILGKVHQHPEWLIRSKRAELVPVVNPALAEVRRYEISLMTELVERYPVEWVHLDYIRFPCEPTEVYFSFDEETRRSFKEFSGEDPLAIKAMDSGNMLWNEWIRWNAGQVTQFIRELRDQLKKFNPSVKISAAVFPDAENASVLIGQDWARWSSEGLVDMLCPMLYTNNDGFFAEYVKRAVHIGAGHGQVCAGIGIRTSHNQNTPEGIMRQVKISRDLGTDGFVLFSGGSLTGEFLQSLKSGR